MAQSVKTQNLEETEQVTTQHLGGGSYLTTIHEIKIIDRGTYKMVEIDLHRGQLGAYRDQIGTRFSAKTLARLHESKLALLGGTLPPKM